jgi:hypothetical protein
VQLCEGQGSVWSHGELRASRRDNVVYLSLVRLGIHQAIWGPHL